MNIQTNTHDSNTIYSIASQVVPPVVTVESGEEYQLTTIENKGIITAVLATTTAGTLVLPPCAPGLTFTLVLAPTTIGNFTVAVNVVDLGLNKLKYIGLKTEAGVVTGDSPEIGDAVTLTAITSFGGVFTITSTSNKIWVISGYWDKTP
jgi:hypothetical protein